MHQSRFLRRVLATCAATIIALLEPVAVAQPSDYFLSEFSSQLLSSGLSKEDPAPVETTTPAPVDEAKLQDVVPDMDFRRFLNKNYFERPNLEQPISAADMETLTTIGGEDRHDAVIVPDVAGENYDYCGYRCMKPKVKPNIDGIQYAKNLEVLAIAHVGQLPELTTMPNLRLLHLDDSHIADYSNLEASKFPALRHLTVTSDIKGAYPTKLNGFTQLDYLALNVNGVGEMPNEITELTTLKTLRYGADDQVHGPANIGNMVGLEKLTLSGKGYLEEARSKLRTLPESMAQLHNLKVLNLFGDKYITKLPEFLLELESLEHVILPGTEVPQDDPVLLELERRGVKV